MNTKIVQVVNAMIDRADLIGPVLINSNEHFFMFNKKHKWSIVKSSEKPGHYNLHFYPQENMSIEELANCFQWEFVDFVTYKTEELKTQEAIESFSELYRVVSDKLYGLDEVFEDIINTH